MRSGAAPAADVATQLEKLEGMRDRGTLSPEEFEAQKRKLLGGEVPCEYVGDRGEARLHVRHRLAARGHSDGFS